MQISGFELGPDLLFLANCLILTNRRTAFLGMAVHISNVV